MRKLIVMFSSLIIGIALLLPLLGCKGDDLAAQVTKVQDATVKACNYLPTAASVAAILSAENPAVIGTVAIANAICAAVSGPSLRSTETECPKVNGVCVEGEFVPPDKK